MDQIALINVLVTVSTLCLLASPLLYLLGKHLLKISDKQDEKKYIKKIKEKKERKI